MFAFCLFDLTTIALAIKPSTKGAFCCDSFIGNMVINGNFEYGNGHFGSGYSYDHETHPGKYAVIDSASQFGADVNDHSYCESSTAYPTNSQFLLVNGVTGKSPGSTSVIWKQTIGGLNSGSEYRFCGNFKNIPQCTFDVLPRVTVELSTGISHSVTIDTDSNNECDWQKISFCFVADNEVTVKILLREDLFGDGNDLAVDDISVQELVDPMLTTTVQHQWGTQLVLASIRTISNSDDFLPYDPSKCNLPWFWFVSTYSNGNVNLAALGNLAGSFIFNPFSIGPSWSLTTAFPGFNFAWGQMYVVGIFTHRCCKECINDGWTAHVVNINKDFPWFIAPSQSPDKTKTGKESFSISDKTLPILNSVDKSIKSEMEATTLPIHNSVGKSIKPEMEVTSSTAGQIEKHLLINVKDFQQMTRLIEEFESGEIYKYSVNKYESNQLNNKHK